MSVARSGSRLLARANICSRMGAFVGVVVGLLFTLVLGQAPATPTTEQAVRIGLLLAAVGFVLVLLLFGVWERYGVGAVLVPAAVVSLLTAVLTAIVLARVGAAEPWGPLVGLVVGLAVGALVCRVRCGGLRGEARAQFQAEVDR